MCFAPVAPYLVAGEEQDGKMQKFPADPLTSRKPYVTLTVLRHLIQFAQEVHHVRYIADGLAYQEGAGKSGSYGMWNHPRGHVWNVLVRPASS